MKRALIIPAAGRGSRLRSDIPKALYPVNGRPMLDHLLARYGDIVERFVLVLSPEFEAMVRAHCAASPLSGRIEYALQERPDGMLPAILMATPIIARWSVESVWIT